MKRFSFRTGFLVAFMCAVIFAAGPALADKPSWSGGGKGNKGNPKESHGKQDWKGGPDHKEFPDKKGPGKGKHKYFTEQQRVYIHDYYAAQYRKGHCPPGLAKKHNGCMPPGQAKKWMVGQPLPKGVVFYDLPRSVLIHLGPPPPNHRYVRVAQDILLMAIGTRMIVDAIDDLNWQFKR